MHELFTKVLSKRDLSRAGELFSIPDGDIVNDINSVLSEIELIILQPDYLQNTNDQSVVEICISRVLSCIRETNTVERFCSSLEDILEICLHYNLKPTGSSKEDPPHAKIAADITSTILLDYKINYRQNKDKKDVMKIFLPIAVKFLPKGNKELSKNLAIYLSLAAIEYSHLLSPQVGLIMDSILAGNYGLCKVLPQLYDVSPDKISMNASLLVSLLPQCETPEKLALLQLFTLIAQKKPTVLESSLKDLLEFLNDKTITLATMSVLLKFAENRPNLILSYFDNIKNSATENPTIALAAQILSTSGKINKEKAQSALDFVLEHLPHADRTTQTILMQEATKLCSTYPVLFSDKVLSCIRQKNTLSQQLSTTEIANKTSGGVTIVNLNSPTTIVTSSTISTISKPPLSIAANSIAITTATTTNLTPSIGINSITSNTISGNHVVTISTNNSISTAVSAIESAITIPAPVPVASVTTTQSQSTHTGYTRRVKLGDSRSTGKLHHSSNTHRSMTRLHGGSVGGLHKSIDRLSSSQQINNGHSSGNVAQQQVNTPIPSNNYIFTLGIPSTTKITSGGVTVTAGGPVTLLDPLNQSSGSISTTPTVSAMQKSITSFPVNSEVVVSGPTTNVTRRNDNTSVTLLNANSSIINQRMSTFEPYQIMRDPVQQFCEKNFHSIKKYMDESSQFLPPPTKCTLEERRSKKIAKLHFACQIRGPHCLYSQRTSCFTMRTKNPKTWIHLMFLDFQVRNYVKEKCVLSTREPGISNLKNLWQLLKCENPTFTELVTSHFPSVKDREHLVNELRHSGFLDVFEVMKTDKSKPNANELEYQWGCFLCNHPDRAAFLHGNNQPIIEGQLKEKKGKWRLFRRWRTRYFTLSGAHLSCKGSSGGESIDVNQIRSVKVSRGARNIPKAFEIFTGDQTLILKPKDEKSAEEWVQCLSIAVAHSQATVKTHSLPSRGIGNNIKSF
ncbi:protein melted isoform X2 [Condylostylus longicornis]|uniref:protein melted isoform X2 n=1 Tax=Condylostylus longicornis TaxID=2530218 RepID=UPI00244E11B3|nr:protein melted isoform X2 [Condylostylus longicornis]